MEADTHTNTFIDPPGPWGCSPESAKALAMPPSPCQEGTYARALPPTAPLAAAGGPLAADSPVFLDFVLDGPRSAAAVFNGDSRLVGVTVAAPGRTSHLPAAAVSAQLEPIVGLPWVCYDAVLAVAVALHARLPFAPTYEDVRAMLTLLDHPPPQALQSAAEMRKPSPAIRDTVENSLARIAAMREVLPTLRQRIASEGLIQVYQEIELPVAIATASMIAAGVPVKPSILHRLRHEHLTRMERARRTLQRFAGRRFNPEDERKVSGFLFGQLGLPAPRETRHGNHATGKAALQPLITQHPAVPALLRYRDAKAVYTAANSMLGAMGPDQRVRPALDPFGTTTGRFACSSPPLQSLPAGVREAVVAPSGRTLMVADYSQVELRILAALSHDRNLLDTLHRGVDLHRRAAAAVLGVAEERVTPEQRQLGKKLNFGMTYGQTAAGLAREFNVSQERAESLLAAHAALYPAAARWIAETHQQAALTGEVRTWRGRRRLVPHIHSPRLGVAGKAQREAVATVIQGTAADLMKAAMVRLNGVLPTRVRMLLSVHDAVLLEVPDNLVEQTRRCVVEAMTTALPGLDVPLQVRVGMGKSWAACE